MLRLHTKEKIMYNKKKMPSKFIQKMNMQKGLL